jgi:hypothetical protein
VTLQGYKTTADPYGSYTITIPADTSGGDYTLTVNAVGYASSTLTFPIPNGATVTEDVVLAQLGALQGFVRVAGTTPGAPVAGATLTIGSQTTQSDATGHYQVSGLVPGYNDITVTAPGYDSVATSLFIVAGGTKAQDFDLTPGTAVLAGTVTDTDGGFPLADATITVAGAVSPASAAADGSYTVVGIPAGTAKVTAEAAEHVTQQTVVSFADQQTVTLDFSLDLDSHGRGHGHGGGGGWPPQ